MVGKSKQIKLYGISMMLFIFISSMGFVNAGIGIIGFDYAANSKLSPSKNKLDTDHKTPIESQQEKGNSKEDCINFEEEVDFLEDYNLSTTMLLIPEFTSCIKVINGDEFILFFHPEQLVPPPKI